VADLVTLDGVMQAPARPDEDTRDGFAHGGWAYARSDAAIPVRIRERMESNGPGGGFLFGLRTPPSVRAALQLVDATITEAGSFWPATGARRVGACPNPLSP
jgi:hypothetical protein